MRSFLVRTKGDYISTDPLSNCNGGWKLCVTDLCVTFKTACPLRHFKLSTNLVQAETRNAEGYVLKERVPLGLFVLESGDRAPYKSFQFNPGRSDWFDVTEKGQAYIRFYLEPLEKPMSTAFDFSLLCVMRKTSPNGN